MSRDWPRRLPVPPVGGRAPDRRLLPHPRVQRLRRLPQPVRPGGQQRGPGLCLQRHRRENHGQCTKLDFFLFKFSVTINKQITVVDRIADYGILCFVTSISDQTSVKSINLFK